MVTHRVHRRGFALVDAIIGGALLALALTGVVTLSQRSLAMLQRGEREAIAAAMLDELLSQVVTEGPNAFSRTRETEGRMAVEIRPGAVGDPYDVLAMVRDDVGGEYRCATRVAPHDEQAPPVERAPTEPLDRAARQELKEANPSG